MNIGASAKCLPGSMGAGKGIVQFLVKYWLQSCRMGETARVETVLFDAEVLIPSKLICLALQAL